MREIVKVVLGKDKVGSICSGSCESTNREGNRRPEVAQLVSSRARAGQHFLLNTLGEGAS